METQPSRPKSIFNKQLMIELICYAYVIFFVYAGVYKLLDFKFFQVSLERSPLIGGFAWELAYLVPIGEIMVSAMLLIKKYRLIGLYLATAIMFGFTLYISYVLFFSPEVPCHCGGILAKMGWKEHLVMNACFVILGGLANYFEKKIRLKGA